MFSATVSAGIDVKCWCTSPIPVARASRGDRRRRGVPSIRISPVSGATIPLATCISVDLAGAILAQQRVHFTSARDETRTRERLHRAESLVDVAELEDRRPGHMPVG